MEGVRGGGGGIKGEGKILDFIYTAHYYNITHSINNISEHVRAEYVYSMYTITVFFTKTQVASSDGLVMVAQHANRV